MERDLLTGDLVAYDLAMEPSRATIFSFIKKLMWILLFLAFLGRLTDVLELFLKSLVALSFSWALYRTFEGAWGEERAEIFKAQVEYWAGVISRVISEL